jgi:hypothetical protein
MNPRSIKMILMGVTVACYFIPIILSCALYFALICNTNNENSETNIIEENLNKKSASNGSSIHNSIKLENNFEIPGMVNNDRSKSFQNIVVNQNKRSHQSKPTFLHLVSKEVA